ncbi:M23 family metallopeptidase [Spongiibacter sp. UBA1325]|uniref:M23 family metallopeptidase n=1 Tax=Spongiibacter sp. UBA1325 TaxID=1947543 RepID=UPI00257C79D3|nr:M23 family metallopeptidase [Spongiibacter sp. UBA1325]|tara:strand:- start:17244 stop:18194 length:951 start_codon:yes stop_codon:yes gene_type:complete
MRDHYQITVTSFERTRHYRVPQFIKHLATGFVAVLGLLFAGGVLAIYVLSNKLDAMDQELSRLHVQQSEIRAENTALLQEQQRLQNSVEEKVAALSMMGEELGSIEAMMGLSPNPDAEIEFRLDTASQTAQEKRYMLTAIPSGYPLEEAKVTSFYGMRKHPVLGKMKLHGGADLRARIGTPVYATANGVVEWAGYNDGGFGKMVKLSHNFGFTTVYGHLSKSTVAVGDYVKQGELIGYSGNTGLSSAPHLHYEVRHLHRRLAPRSFMEWSLENYDGLFKREERIKWDSLAKTVRDQTALPERRLSLRGPISSGTSS